MLRVNELILAKSDFNVLAFKLLNQS